MKPIVFCGPTIGVDDADRHLVADYRPPAALGDVYRAARDGCRLVGIIDGYFERVPATWHKEILWSLSRGTHVWGAASIGALRAAELSPFGMVGIGGIYEEYVAGVLEDDDEVAVAHAADDTFRATSEAMVNIRATLERARALGVVTPGTQATLEARAKALFYPQRTWPEVLATTDIPVGERAALLRWLPRGAVDRKRADAVDLLRAMGRLVDRGLHRHEPAFAFERTTFWDAAETEIHGHVSSTGDFVSSDRIHDELTFDADRYSTLRHRAVARAGAANLPAPNVRRAVVELASLEARGSALCDRAARKSTALAEVGWAEVTADDLGLDRDTLVRWWFETIQGRQCPQDLGAYAARLDVGEITFLRILRREYAYRAVTRNGSVVAFDDQRG